MSVPAAGQTSAQLIAALESLGQSRASIARALGRNSSLISQVARGAKPGANLAPALAELQQRAAGLERGAPLPTPSATPARRTTKAGTEAATRQARVRQKDTRGGDRWGVSPVKRQGTQNGARRLAAVLENARLTGRQVAWGVTVSPKARVGGSGGKAPVQHKRRGTTPASQEVELGPSAGGGDPGWWLDRIDAAGGDVTEAVRAVMLDVGMAESLSRDQVWGLELRTWTE